MGTVSLTISNPSRSHSEDVRKKMHQTLASPFVRLRVGYTGVEVGERGSYIMSRAKVSLLASRILQQGSADHRSYTKAGLSIVKSFAIELTKPPYYVVIAKVSNCRMSDPSGLQKKYTSDCISTTY